MDHLPSHNGKVKIATLFENLGFTNHPFVKTNADEEPELAQYFVPPPYFNAVVGDAGQPSAAVVLAPRGAGKTALRRMVESHASQDRFLAVTYDRFEFSSVDKPENISLQYHLRNIITRILVSYLSYLVEYPDVLNKLDERQKNRLGLFVTTYLGGLTSDSFQELLSSLKSLPDKLREWWSSNIGIAESVVNFILKKFELPSIDLPDVEQEKKDLSSTYKFQLEQLRDLVQALGFTSIYVLIDRVDETEHTGNDPEATYQLIKPLIKDLEILGLPGFGFKFFLWDAIEPYYREDARPDRVAQFKLSWNRSGLKQVLSKRIRAFSKNGIENFSALVEDDFSIEADDGLAIMAFQSPRNLIRMCEQIFAAQAEIQVASNLIESAAVNSGVTKFSEMVCQEVYGDELLKSIQRVGRELFTTNYVANDVLKISGQAVRNKITAWAKSGVVKNIGTVAVADAKKPHNFYCIIDPAAVRMIHRGQAFDSFIQDRWLPCNHCSTDNLIDIAYYPPGNTPVCSHCSRDLL